MWKEYTRTAKVYCNEIGLSVRDERSNELIQDYTFSSIESTRVMSRHIMVLKSKVNSNLSAIQLSHDVDLRSIESILLANKITLLKDSSDNDSFDIPDISNPMIQDHVLKLLFCPKFQEFATKLATLLDSISNIPIQQKGSKQI